MVFKKILEQQSVQSRTGTFWNKKQPKPTARWTSHIGGKMNEKINSAQRALRVIKVLQNNSFVGLSNKDIAQALNESPTNISRTLDVLKNEGFVIKLESGKFAFSSLFAQIAMRHAANMDKASAQINEMKQRLGTAAY